MKVSQQIHDDDARTAVCCNDTMRIDWRSDAATATDNENATRSNLDLCFTCCFSTATIGNACNYDLVCVYGSIDDSGLMYACALQLVIGIVVCERILDWEIANCDVLRTDEAAVLELALKVLLALD